MRSLFDPVQISSGLALQNRFVMAAMTRNFAAEGHCANSRIAEYYERRALGGAGLILTEGIIVDERGDGYVDVPWMTHRRHAESWVPVLDRVHRAGAAMVCQLWHCGRISHSDFTGGHPPLSSTDRPAEGINRQNGKPFGVPERLTAEGIVEVYGQHVRAAKLALDAGFDGVELHLGHGYLADQFFDARINDRVDEYGGSVENRCRFALGMIENVLSHVPAEKVWVRISPSRDMGGIYDWPELDEMLNYFIPRMQEMGVRLLDVSCARADYDQTSGRVIRMIRPLWKGLIAGGASLSPERAEREVREGILDLVTWGRMFIANPDLPLKVKNQRDLSAFELAMLKDLR